MRTVDIGFCHDTINPCFRDAAKDLFCVCEGLMHQSPLQSPPRQAWKRWLAEQRKVWKNPQAYNQRTARGAWEWGSVHIHESQRTTAYGRGLPMALRCGRS